MGRNRRAAERELAKVQVAQDDEVWEPATQETFNEWADEWFASLRRPNESTRRSYISTLGYARKAFGEKKLAKLTARDVQAFVESMTRTVKRDGKTLVEPISASTQAKHLRVLSAVFKSAVKRRKMTRNPVDELDDSHRPQPSKSESAYFDDDEIQPLLAALFEHDRPLVRFAFATGMRAGELIALRWRNVDLSNRVLYVREAYKDGLGVSEPKSKTSRRQIKLANGALATLEDLVKASGRVPADDELVFPPLFGDDYRRTYDLTRRVLYPAMEKAGIPRTGPTGEERTFHSLRHTYARITLEAGGDIAALSRRMGHSTVAVTQNVYGHWSTKAEEAEIARLDAALEEKGLVL